MAPIKTALLSFGMSGKIFHAPFIDLHPGFELAGSWERSQKNIQSIYPGTTSFQSFEEILQDPSIDLVVVNTPTNSHFDYAKQVLLAGKNAIVEKAFTTTVSEAVELKELAEKVGKKLAVYQNRRYDSDFRTMQRILKSGILGRLVDAEFHYDRYKPLIGPKLHKENPGPGAGLLNDLGPHLIDQALCLFGMPKELYADIRVIRDDSKVDDWFDITFYYTDLRVRLKSSNICREPIQAFQLHGVNGSFLKNMADVQENALLRGEKPNFDDWGLQPDSERGLLHAEKDGVEIKEKVPTERGNYYDFFDGVYKAIKDNTAMPVTADDGISVMKILEAALKSNEAKAVVTV